MGFKVSTLLSFKQISVVKNIPVYYLSKNWELQLLAEIFQDPTKQLSKIAIDQERASYQSVYYQRPCLLQLATTEYVFLIDLNSIRSLNSLSNVLTSCQITKIFFDSPWDLFYFKDYHNIEIRGIFDIQAASSLLQRYRATISLEDLVNQELKIHYVKPKKQQKSNWCQRPLTNSQIKYASEEIYWFIPLYNKILDEIIRKKRELFLYYIHNQIQEDLPSLEYNPFSVIRIKGFSELTEIQKLQLFRIAKIRDEIALKRNKPSFFIFNNQTLINLVIVTPEKRKKLLQRKKYLSSEDIKAIHEVLENIKSLPSETFEEIRTKHNNNNPPFNELPVLKQHLLIWRNEISKELNLPKRFILSKRDLNLLDYSNKKILLDSIWFTKRSDEIAQYLTNSVTTFLLQGDS